MRMGKTYDLVFTTKIVAVLTFLSTGRKKYVFLYTFAMWKEKLGGYLIDVSKYVLTGIVIASLFKDMGNNKLLVYGIGMLVAGFTLLSGLLLTNKKEKK